jgi:hypothetical protein
VVTETDPSHCPECDGPYVWGGMSWYTGAHTDAFHARRRLDHLRALRRVLNERIAVRLGHVATIRFAGKQAWYECACGSRGTTFVGSTSGARAEAHQHLYVLGSEVIALDLLKRFWYLT